MFPVHLNYTVNSHPKTKSDSTNVGPENWEWAAEMSILNHCPTDFDMWI